MIVRAVKTKKVTGSSLSLLDLLDDALPTLQERSIVAIASKVAALCEGRVVPKAGTDLEKLVREEADWYMPQAEKLHGFVLTIAHDMLTPNSGIDESNANDSYVLWPAAPQLVVNNVRRHLCRRFKLKHLGVLIVDSGFMPLRWGAIGLCLAYSGFQPARNYGGQQDLFGRPLAFSKTNMADGLATAATFMMGEGAEQTPLAVFEDLPQVEFLTRDPTGEELAARRTPLEEDSFAPLLTSVQWLPGGKTN
ncbi:MAG TPA: coenzyme F420-0:L-glutamate ligase [Candidatus Saccharimonadales bacterium]|jgi:F420-0:gamma-glutamyl ligase